MTTKKKTKVERARSPPSAAPLSTAASTAASHDGTAAPHSVDSQVQRHVASSSPITKPPKIAPMFANPITQHKVYSIRTFYETGRFLTAPRTYSELLRTYVEFMVYCVPSTASAATALAPPSNPRSPATTAVATVDVETQVHTLLFAAIPHRVATYFTGVQLTAEKEEKEREDLSKEACAPHAVITTAGRKRGRCTFGHRDTKETQRAAREDGSDKEETKNTSAIKQKYNSDKNNNSYTADTELSEGTMLHRLAAYGASHLTAFDSDSAYLAAKDVFVYLKHYAYLFTGMSLSSSLLKSIEVAGLDFRRQCVPCVEAIVRLVEQLTIVQREKMPLAPRVVRLSSRLQLSAKAAQTLEYLLVCHCGRYTAGAIAEPLRPANIAYHNDLTPQELLSILSESGVLWKQGLAFSDIKLRASFMECKYALPLETIAALSGDQLSEEQLIKLERTALSEVLIEERQLKSARSVSPVRGVTSATTAAAHATRDSDVNDKSSNKYNNSASRDSTTRNTAVLGVRSGNPSRRTSRSPLPRWRGDAEASSNHRNSKSGDDDDYDQIASTAESTLTLAEDALDDALDQIDSRILTSGDDDATQEAVAQHPPSTAAADARRKATIDAAETAEKVEREEEEEGTINTTGEPANNSSNSSDESKNNEVAPLSTENGIDANGAAAAAAAGRKPQLTLADINPLAQRYRHGTASLYSSPSSASAASPQTDSSMRDKPYESDIEYMDAAFRILANIIRIRYAEGDMKDEEDTFTPKNKVEASLRELKGKVRVAAAVHESRLQATLAANTFTPRIEQLARRLKLTEMEKQIMLFMIGNAVSHDMLVAVNGRYVMRDGQRLITVGYMLFVLCETLEERVVARRAFYQSAPLVVNGVLSLSFETSGRSCFNTDLMDYLVDIDRKIVDDVMGIVADTSEMVPGSQLYFPSVELSNVVLPSSTMQRVLSTIEHYSLFEQCKKRSGFGDGLGMSKGGLVMLFFGPSGTGKTMLANAVAHHLQKKILLVSISQFRSSTKAENEALKFLFREAKLNDAIIFFDECESLFEDRQSNTTVTALLSEFERYEGLIILATNKAQCFDEAMNRRISLMMEFRPPDHQLRLRIWKSHIPKQLTLAEDVSLEKLALNYELSGGLIRNAVLAALSQAVAREKSVSPTLTMADLDEGARLQLRGFFLAAERPEGMSEFYVTPKRTLAELVLEAPLARRLETIASVAKSRSTLYTQWGFSEDANDDCGALYLFQGVSGTGKSLAAEGIAYECGATIRLCNVAELLLREEMRVHAVFEEGRRLGAIIIFDEAQVLFNESPKSLQLSQLIQYHARRYPRPVIVIATTTSRDGGGGRQLFSTTSINSRSSCMLFQSEMTFVLPNRQLREQLWRRAFPERVPLATDVDYGTLSAVSISPKLIRTVAFSVCCEAALLPVAQRTVTMSMIEREVEKALLRERSAVSTSAMFA